jgi:hypothetical protein
LLDIHMVHRLICLLCFAAAAPPVNFVRAQPAEVTLRDVMKRAGAYVVDFQRELSGIVAEERYVQDVRYVLQSYAVGSPRSTASQDARRVLMSDLLLVRPSGATRWVQFRDVFEVDGKPVHDRSERLFKLFVEPTASSAQQVDDIVRESSRYNIGNLQRTINVPLLALLILDPANQRRFAFERTQDRKPRLGSEPKSTSDAPIWVVEYHEESAGTLIRGSGNHDIPSHGRFWIDATSGQVVGTELIADDTTLKGTVNVIYRLEPAVHLLVPAEMRERYEVRRDGSRVDGTATYSKFRQFQVKVDEKIAPLKPEGAGGAPRQQ